MLQWAAEVAPSETVTETTARMRVLVTGGAGFIGAPTAIELRRRGHDVVAVGRNHVAPRWADAEGITYAAADLTSAGGAIELLSAHQPETIVQLAWFTQPSSYLTNRGENVASLAASLQLLSAAERVGCSRVVFGGTCLEDAAGGDSVYARMKRLMHDVASEYFEADRPRTACAHIFSAYGPGEHPDRAIPSIIRALSAGEPFPLTDCKPRRDYLHVWDIAAALATIAESTAGGQIDVCSGSSLPLREVFSLLAQFLDGERLLRFGEVASSSNTSFDVDGDPTRIEELGWSPSHTLETGLRSTVDWWTSVIAKNPRLEH